MKVIYIANGNVVYGEIPESTIVLPVLVKEYYGYQHTVVVSCPAKHKDWLQVKKAERKKNENLQFFKLEVELTGEPNTVAGWKLKGTDHLQESTMELFASNWLSRIDSFVRTNCNLTGLIGQLGTTDLGDTFFLQDVKLAGVSNCTVHLFGSGQIMLSTLENVLLFVHGDYDEV